MSASLIVLVPLLLLGLVTALCFVGCYHDVTLPVTSFGDYENTIINTPNLVAYWPLDDTSGTTALDLGPNHFNGAYTQGQSVPYNPVDESAAASGAVILNQPGIVVGDQQNNKQSPCIFVDGGFVSVPFQAALNPQPPFTIEAWVVPSWTASDVANNPAYRVVVASGVSSTFQGFALFASPQNYWAAIVGTGSQGVTATPPPGSNQTIAENSLYFLVMTYDGTTLNLWVDPADTSTTPYAQAAASPFAPLPSPIPFYIGTGRPDLPTPLLPFNGYIQDVAFYNVVLDGHTIEDHYMNGLGMTM